MSFLETLVILIVAVIVLGPKRLPEVARKIGKWSGMARRAGDEFKRQLMMMDQTVEASVNNLETLAPEGDVLTEEELAILRMNEMPPVASPDDAWDQPPVPGGLAPEPVSAVASASEPSGSTDQVSMAADEESPVATASTPKPAIRVHPTSIAVEPEHAPPRSLGLSPTKGAGGGTQRG